MTAMPSINTKKVSFAYVQNQRFPNEFSFGIHVVKSCEAAVKLNYKTYLIHPEISQPKSFPFSDLWDYFQVKKNIFNQVKLKVLEFPGLKHLRQPVITWIFSVKACLYLSRHNIEIIQTTCREVIFLLRWFYRYKPKIIYDVHVEPRTWYEKLLDWLALPRINIFVINSPFYKAYYQKKGINLKQMAFLPGGYDPIWFRTNSNQNKLRQVLELPLKRFIVGFIGRFATFGTEKGIKELIQLIKDLKSSVPVTLLAIGGPVELANKYRLLAKKLKLSASEVIIRDQVKPKAVSNYLNVFDVACMLYPDTYHFKDKMSPQKLVEYMAMNKPIITTDLPSIRFWVDQDLVYFIKPGDKHKLIQVVKSIYKNSQLAKQKALKAYQYVQHFTWEKRQQKILKSVTK